MLKLELDRQPRWLDLPHGVKVQVRPLTTTITEAAFAEGLEHLRPFKLAAEDAAKAGTPMDPLGPNGANAAWLQGMHWHFLVAALVRYGAIAWEGLSGDDGEPLPITSAACIAFAAHPDLGREFFARYRDTLSAVDAEGNGSAPSFNGGSAGAPSTATHVPAAPSGPAAAAGDPAAPTAPAS